jgi:hypothetical protein
MTHQHYGLLSRVADQTVNCATGIPRKPRNLAASKTTSIYSGSRQVSVIMVRYECLSGKHLGGEWQLLQKRTGGPQQRRELRHSVNASTASALTADSELARQIRFVLTVASGFHSQPFEQFVLSFHGLGESQVLYWLSVAPFTGIL